MDGNATAERNVEVDLIFFDALPCPNGSSAICVGDESKPGVVTEVSVSSPEDSEDGRAGDLFLKTASDQWMMAVFA